MGFLRKFGYLEEGLPNSAALYQESAIQSAISTMQRFGGLNPTGRIDNNTLQVNRLTFHLSFIFVDPNTQSNLT
jgi:Putative peptidoglycan binding domain